MTTVKKTSGDYIVDTANMTITGNLYVLGNSSIISSETLEIADNKIVLNSGETGHGVTLVYSGVQIDRGTAPDVSVIWDESDESWKLYQGEVESDNDNWVYILTSDINNVGLTEVFDDKTPELGGNLNINTHTIYSSANDTVVILDAPNGGDSGVYVTNSKRTTAQELVTKRKSLVYSLIL